MILTFIFYMLMWGALFTGLLGLLVQVTGLHKSSPWISVSAFCFFALAIMIAILSINEKMLLGDSVFCIPGSLVIDILILGSIKLIKDKKGDS